MTKFSNKLKPRLPGKALKKQQSQVISKNNPEEFVFSASLDENLKVIRQLLGNNIDLVFRDIQLGRSEIRRASILYIDNLVDALILDGHIMRPLVLEAYTSGLQTGPEIIEQLQAGNLISRASLRKGLSVQDLMRGLLIGEIGLFIDGVEGVLILCSKGFEHRSIAESDVEPVVRGSREAFVETLNTNIGLIRRRLQSTSLVIEGMKIGTVSQTDICIVYIQDICLPEMVAEVRRRLERINIQGVLDSGSVEKFIQDHPFSPFPQVRNTEKPDVIVASLLEGRAAILVDNTPIALVVPGEFFSLMEASEDYYTNQFFANAIRFIRYLALFIALVLPATYIAFTTYHQEMIPTELLISIMSSRAGVPFPAFLEAVIMEITFEVLREAGVRLPKQVGQAVSIVGALVIGQAAVQGGLVSPLLVVVVAFTGVASFTIPQYNVSLPLRVLRFPLMLLAAFMGLFGVIMGCLVILLHLCSLKSFGVPYLAIVSPFTPSIKDLLLGVPWWTHVDHSIQSADKIAVLSAGQIARVSNNGSDVN